MFNYTKVELNCPRKLIPSLFLSGFSFTDTDDSQGGRGREGTIFYSILPLPSAHKHLGIYLPYSTLSYPPAHKHLRINLQLCMWDGYHIFFITTLVFTRLVLDELYHLIEFPFHYWWYIIFCLFTWWFDTRFFTFVLQTNRLTKRASQVFMNFFANACFFVNNILLHFMSTYFSTFYISIGNAVIVQVSFFWKMFLWSDNSTEKQNQLSNRENM